MTHDVCLIVILLAVAFYFSTHTETYLLHLVDINVRLPQR